MNTNFLNQKRKGVVEGLTNASLSIVIFAIIAAAGAIILAEFGSQTTDGNATAVISEGQSALTDLAGWLPIVVVVLVAGLVIFLVVRGLGGFRFGGAGGV